MSSSSTIDVLNRLLALHNRSLPMYLSDAVPWTCRADDQACQTLALIASAQRKIVDRLGTAVLDRDGSVRHGEFPLRFADWNDLSMDFLLSTLITSQQRDIAEIEQCISQLTSDPLAKGLAEEALGEARGHLESLQELVSGTAGV